jgi:hypothetical protein
VKLNRFSFAQFLPNILYKWRSSRGRGERNGTRRLPLSPSISGEIMVAIKNDSTYALMALSRRFAETADKLVKASTSDFDAREVVETTMERQPSAPPAIQSENLPTSEADGESGIDLGQEMVRLNTTETYYVANLRVVATKDELLGTVLDIFA